MKILHLPASYLPWTVGGKEVYCHTLCQGLAARGVENVVAIHRNAAEPVGRHRHEGVPVHVLPPLPGEGSRRVAYTKTYDALPGFEELLDEVRPDAAHFHDQAGSASLSHLKVIKVRGIPAVVTYHSPGQTCPQSSLLRWGHIPCDGEVRLGRCTSCRLNFSGVPRLLSDVAALAEWPGVPPWSESALARVLTGRMMTRLFRASLHEFMERIDAVVVLAEWARGVWRINGAPKEKLHLIRTGGPAAYAGPRGPHYPERSPLRVACLGRCTWIKGFHVLVEAVKRLPLDATIEVLFLGPYWDSSYGRSLRQRIDGDRRFLPPRVVPNADLLPVLAGMDVVAVPSVWLETGPLTMFDAFAAGVPVVGSRLGGIAEVVRDGVDGILFEPGNAAELASCLGRLLIEKDLLPGLRGNVQPPRSTLEIAGEMTMLYQQLLRQSVTTPSAKQPADLESSRHRP